MSSVIQHAEDENTDGAIHCPYCSCLVTYEVDCESLGIGDVKVGSPTAVVGPYSIYQEGYKREFQIVDGGRDEDGISEHRNRGQISNFFPTIKLIL